MRILIDLQSCQSGSRHGGIGRYSLALALAMIKREPSWDFLILLNENFPQQTNEVRSEFNGVLPPGNIVTFQSPRRSASVHANADLTRAAEILRERFIAALN